MSSQKVNFLLRKAEVTLYIVKQKSLWESLKDCRNENNEVFWSGGIRVFHANSKFYIRFEDEQKKVLFGVCEVMKFPDDNFCNLSFSNRHFLAKIKVKAENMDATFIVSFANELDSMDLIHTLQTASPPIPLLLGKRSQSTQSSTISSSTSTEKEDDEVQVIEIIRAKQKPNPQEGSSSLEPEKKLQKIQKPFPCTESLCPCSFDSWSLLKDHWIESHNFVHPCLCAKCKNPCSSLLELQNHRVKYHGFECPNLNCKLVFGEAAILEKHYFEMHANSYKFSS